MADMDIDALTVTASDTTTITADNIVTVENDAIINADEGVNLAAGATSLISTTGSITIRADVDADANGNAAFGAGTSIIANGPNAAVDIAGRAISFDTISAAGEGGSIKLNAAIATIATTDADGADITADTVDLDAITGTSLLI